MLRIESLFMAILLPLHILSIIRSCWCWHSAWWLDFARLQLQQEIQCKNT